MRYMGIWNALGPSELQLLQTNPHDAPWNYAHRVLRDEQ